MAEHRSVFYQELKQTGFQELQENMSRALGLTTMVVHPDGRPLTEPSNLCPFCALVNTSREGLARCAASRAACAKAAEAAGKEVLKACHAGLVHLAVPLKVAGETVAAILCGNVALRPLAEEEVTRLARETGIDRERLLAVARAVPLWTEERLRTVAAAVQKVTDTVAQLLYAKQELGRKADELAALFEFSQTVAGSLEVDEVGRRALQAVLKLTGATSGSVVMLGEEVPGVANAEVAATLESCDALRVVPSGRIVAAVERETRAVHFNSRPGGGTREERRPAVAIPLIVGGKATGVLTVAGRPEGAGFAEDETAFLIALGTSLGLALENARLYSSLREYYLSAVRALAAALEAKDVYTRGHSLRVAQWARACARMLGLGAEEQEQVYLAGLLHDLGKIGVREDILLKPGRLNEEERKEMQSHPVVGARILEPARFPPAVIAAVRLHHEDYGGGGYPAGLVGEEIPLLARIIRVADAYDAMTSARPYREALSAQQAREELSRCAGRQFDPRVVEAFLRIPAEELADSANG
ncbi:MAG: PocR ligand-binding domain-containing protein, partial [Firmicutes bacterium]|nr:PocR ligand-binding domain-containing protein [Bacillota bacterium]